jgi:hypothetical protein
VRFTFAAFMVYADITYASGAAEMLRLATTRPDLASLSTAQALYGLPTAGTCRNADGSSSACQNYILEITNRSSLAHELDRPEIFISGALHGDERIGPSTALALSRWLIERYDTDPWMRRLVDQRIILVMPMTNAIGVEQRRRDELTTGSTARPTGSRPATLNPRAGHRRRARLAGAAAQRSDTPHRHRCPADGNRCAHRGPIG